MYLQDQHLKGTNIQAENSKTNHLVSEVIKYKIQHGKCLRIISVNIPITDPLERERDG